MLDISRVQKELAECNRDKSTSGVSIQLNGDDLSHLSGTISGPVATPYEGGTFQIDIRLPGNIKSAPFLDFFCFRSHCLRRILAMCDERMIVLRAAFALHPNISSQNGAICLDILKDQWSPALTLKTALLSLQALLSAPEPDDPQDAVVAQQVF
ncbi:Ubiquitin-conjugating enzyme E2 27 [Asimina triloba]